MNDLKHTTKTQQAIQKYGREACLKAFELNTAGEGASTIALTMGGGTPVAIKTTLQADAAINAGREISEHLRIRRERQQAQAQKWQEERERREAQRRTDLQQRAKTRADQIAAQMQFLDLLRVKALQDSCSPLESLLLNIGERLKTARKELTQWHEEFALDPLRQMSWSQGTFEHATTEAVCATVLVRMMEALNAPEQIAHPVLLGRLKDWILDEVTRRSRNVPQSSSATSNLAEAYETAAWAKLAEAAKWGAH